MRELKEKTFWRKWLLQWGGILAVSTLLGIAYGFQIYFMGMDWGNRRTSFLEAVYYPLLDWFIWGIMAGPLLLVIDAFRFSRGRRLISLLAHSISALLPGVLHIFAFVAAVNLIGYGEPKTFPPFRGTLIKGMPSSLLIYLLIAAFACALDFYMRYQEGLVRAARLREQLAGARLQALRMQLHPHFLFNTLNSISALLHRDADAADRMIARLGDFLRMTLDEAGSQEVPLSRELDFLRNYLEIEKIRFQTRLITRIEAEPVTLDMRVPYLILQPIVENAIRHGIAPRMAPGTVEIRASRSNGSLCLEVEDDGRGFLQDAPLKEGLGISNTRARLEQLYGGKSSFEISPRSKGGVLVTVTLPAIEYSSGEGSEQ